MVTLDELAHDEQISDEYKKTFLLAIFKKLCQRMKNDEKYKVKILNLYKQSLYWNLTVRSFVEREYGCGLSESEAETMAEWIIAFFRKKQTRKALTSELKQKLYHQQNGLCLACGEPLGDNMSKIHVDHIIPWTLVGDELENNYQDLCETCNECKSSRIDYILLKKMKLI